jgi:hypothetical protein
MWSSIYDYFVQLFAGLKWSAFLAQNNNNIVQATRLRNVFRNDLYSISGMVTIGVTITVAAIYYFVCNRKGGSGYAFRPKFWFIALLINSFSVAITMMYISLAMTKSYSMLHPFKYCLSLGFTNLIYSAILFFACALVFKKYSVASTTPF